jgi:hypothetical protein
MERQFDILINIKHVLVVTFRRDIKPRIVCEDKLYLYS